MENHAIRIILLEIFGYLFIIFSDIKRTQLSTTNDGSLEKSNPAKSKSNTITAVSIITKFILFLISESRRLIYSFQDFITFLSG